MPVLDQLPCWWGLTDWGWLDRSRPSAWSGGGLEWLAVAAAMVDGGPALPRSAVVGRASPACLGDEHLQKRLTARIIAASWGQRHGRCCIEAKQRLARMASPTAPWQDGATTATPLPPAAQPLSNTRLIVLTPQGAGLLQLLGQGGEHSDQVTLELNPCDGRFHRPGAGPRSMNIQPSSIRATKGGTPFGG